MPRTRKPTQTDFVMLESEIRLLRRIQDQDQKLIDMQKRRAALQQQSIDLLERTVKAQEAIIARQGGQPTNEPSPTMVH